MEQELSVQNLSTAVDISLIVEKWLMDKRISKYWKNMI